MTMNLQNKKTNTLKKASNGSGSRKAPNSSVPWGRAASEYRPGLFTKQYFVEHGEACAADIYRSLTEKIKTLNEERVWIGDTPLLRPNYSSFSRYFHWFLIIGSRRAHGQTGACQLQFLTEEGLLQID